MSSPKPYLRLRGPRALASLTFSVLAAMSSAARGDSPALPASLTVTATVAAEAESATAPELALAAGVAVVPGLVLHGAGHLARGQLKAAAQLFAIQGLGLALAFGGYGILEATGASRRIVAPVAVMTVSGLGLVASTWLMDLYGVLAPAIGTGAPLLKTYPVEVELGALYVADAVLDRGAFTVIGGNYLAGPARVGARASASVGEDELIVEIPAAYRIYGPRPDRASKDGTFLELVPSMRHHRLGNARFSITTFELEVAGRLDLTRLIPTLSGSFAELSAGAALQTHHYFERGLDPSTLLLLRFGWGFYLGAPERLWGEVSLAYDHRHDLLAAGLKLPGSSSGVFGHGVLAGTLYAPSGIGVRLELAAGSTVVGGASLLYRFGGAE